MALIPRGFGSTVLDPFFGGSSLWDPFETVSRSLFDQAFPSFDKTTSAVANTRIDWIETLDAHIFKADLPGLRKEDIKVQVSDDGVLSISGERVKEKIDENDTYRREERTYGKFFRQFKLPPNAKLSDVCAKVENGVLAVCVPKTEEAKKQTHDVRNVEIAGGRLY